MQMTQVTRHAEESIQKLFKKGREECLQRHLPISLVSSITETHEGSVSVGTSSARMATTIVGETLVNVLAFGSITSPSVPTAALEGTLVENNYYLKLL